MEVEQDIPIIDSHIHLYAKSHIPRLSWTGDLPADHVLNQANTVEVYKQATSSARNVKGFVFLETDRKSGLRDDQWDDALEEAAFLSRIARGEALPDEGHTGPDGKLVLGIVPWAPVAAGPDALARYVGKVRDLYPEAYRDRVKGFRYLLQDKKPEVMLQDEFLASLIWLGEHDLSFDLGIDARGTGLFQLDEACQMLAQLYGRGATTRIVINHFCKPNLRLSNDEALLTHNDFVRWKAYIEKMASHPLTFMKLSGLFSELPAQSPESPADVQSLVDRIRPWAEVVFKCFTPERIMFGSDWPVCNVGGPGPDKSWTHWHQLVTVLLKDFQVDEEGRRCVWSGTAARAYNIQPSESH